MRFTKLSLSAGAAFTFLLFQNFTLPEFPLINVETRTVQKEGADQLYRTTTPHIPANEFTQDGRLALRRRSAGKEIPFFVMKPENLKARGIKYLKQPGNVLVGANVMERDQFTFFNPTAKMQAVASDKMSGFDISQSFICEKTEKFKNPYVCDVDKDCYKITLVMRLSNEARVTSEADIRLRLASVDLIVKVSNPKTINANIGPSSIFFDGPNQSGNIKVSDNLENSTLNETTIAGDNRLMVSRVGDGRAYLTSSTSNTASFVDNINIMYSVYPESEEQCDVLQWQLNNVHPISHAHYDKFNNMRRRYKFARFPMRDTLGRNIPDGKDLGGSYPWVDKEAANIFFTAFGSDSFYNYRNSRIITPYNLPDPTNPSNLLGISMDHSDDQPSSSEGRYPFEAIGSRTVGISMVGFWTQGKIVLLDGQLNNADYNFSINPDRDEGYFKVDRKFKLYDRVPDPKYEDEIVGAVRELGSGINRNIYDPNLVPNSTFMGSIQNRLNHIDEMIPVVPRDVVWHFGSTRHEEEFVFDDYINPYFLINSDMTGAVAWVDNLRTMQHLDGYHGGIKSDPYSDLVALNRGISPLLFQNAAVARENLLVPPSFGLPLNQDMRLEPIAKGGIYGKGLWFEKNYGLSYKVPAQSANSIISPSNAPARYFSVFIDPRVPVGEISTVGGDQLFSMKALDGNTESVYLLQTVGNGNVRYSALRLKVNNRMVADFVLPAGLTLKPNTWSNIGIQFKDGIAPEVYINGYYAGSFSAVIGQTLPATFFQIKPDSLIYLGSSSTDPTQKLGLRGWVDEFKVELRTPTLEEKCNYARGTLVSSTNPVVNRYPAQAHVNVSNSLPAGSSQLNKKYMCYTKYGSENGSNPVKVNEYAHMKNIPVGDVSIRMDMLLAGKPLIYGRSRPNQRDNQFCISCHLPITRTVGIPELNEVALMFLPGLKAEDDRRRQPMQPPAYMSGVIPADYFGPGKPMTTIKTNVINSDGTIGNKIDQWVLPSGK